jgi:hypothetical protein
MKRPDTVKANWRSPLWRLFIVGGVITLWLFRPIVWPGGWGIGKDHAVTTTSVEKDRNGNITKSVETTKIDDGKTLWDWLSLLGVPASLIILGYRLQQIQQKRAEEAAKALRERDEKAAKELRERDEKAAQELRDLAADETKEEVLQVYFDRVSVLLVEKNLLAISANRLHPGGKELISSSLNVIRARTLSILQRFKNDIERKNSVIGFLLEADIVNKLKLDLSGADLSGVDLSHANLSHANLKSVNLSHADLGCANLYRANLVGANLCHANLVGADLVDADLRLADLRNTKFVGANLSGANVTEEQLKDAKLCQTTLPDGITLDRNRDC